VRARVVERGVGGRNPARGGGPALRLALAVGVGVLEALACTEHERPERLADVSTEDARRVVTGSFRAPTGTGISGGASGGASGCGSSGAPCGGATGLDAGSNAMTGSGPMGSGSSSTGGASGSTGAVAGSGSGPASNGTSDGPISVRQSYAASCEDSTVQWGFFTYAATTPGDSSIRMRVRTAPTEDGLQSARFLDLLTASTALGTARCTFTGPAPCPIDLFEVLGGAPLVHHPLSELEVVLTPSSIDQRMPTVDDWQLDYSCTFDQ
jgi:hypothetical protein